MVQTRRQVLGLAGLGALAPLAMRHRDGDVLIDESSFADYRLFERTWNYLYPWGSDHNGSARMFGSPTDHSHIYLSGGVLTLKATHITEDEGTSSSPPHLPIRYHSGTIHAKPQVLVDQNYPRWDLRGEFQATSTVGTWPAFWITGVDSWPPESDILEYKGTAQNWFNTYKDAAGDWSSSIIDVPTPGSWHSYRAHITQANATDVDIRYYLDGALKGTHRGANFVGKAMWIILDLQMEGSSGSPGPVTDTYFRARNLRVTRYRS